METVCLFGRRGEGLEHRRGADEHNPTTEEPDQLTHSIPWRPTPLRTGTESHNRWARAASRRSQIGHGISWWVGAPRRQHRL